MAVKKKVNNEEIEVNVLESEDKVEVSDNNETEVNEEVLEVEVPEVEVENTEDKASDVDVDVDNTEVKDSNRPNSGVKIRMRTDHSCTIAMQRYDLKAGKTYVVPANVKRILNNAGLLSPL